MKRAGIINQVTVWFLLPFLFSAGHLTASAQETGGGVETVVKEVYDAVSTVSGTVKASSWKNQSELELQLSGDTVIQIDTRRTLKSLSVYTNGHALTFRGTDTLAVYGYVTFLDSKDSAENVNGGSVSFESGKIYVENDGSRSSMNNAIPYVAMSSRVPLYVKGGVLYLTTATSPWDSTALDNLGTLLAVSGGEMTVVGRGYGIETGRLAVYGGRLQVTSGARAAVSCVNDMTFQGGIFIAQGGEYNGQPWPAIMKGDQDQLGIESGLRILVPEGGRIRQGQFGPEIVDVKGKQATNVTIAKPGADLGESSYWYDDDWWTGEEDGYDEGEWVKSGNGWWYDYGDGTYPANTWEKIDGKWYHFDADGYMQTGWVKVGGKWYYMDSSGAMQTGWKKLGGKWYYLNSGGDMATGWKQIDGKWYYLNKSGVMQTGWYQSGSTWYFLKNGGDMATGWVKAGGKWYYMKNSGAMTTGWQKVGGKWYYMQGSGAMKTGWQKVGSTWYYLDSSGEMLSSISRRIGNKTYNFNVSGACTNP